MNRTTLLLAAVAALVAVTGTVAAAPAGIATADTDTADVSEPADATEQAGPPDDLPGPVPGFVSEILGAINGFIDGTVDSLGSAVSGVAGGSEGDAEPFPTETPTGSDESAADGSDGTDATGADSTDATGADGTADTAEATPRFGVTIDSIEECGQTCRDVTSTLTNNQDTTAEDVTVYTRIFVGQGTDGDVVWRGQESVGTLGSGDATTATKRVELSLSEGFAVRNDGWITIQTTVETADRTVTYTETRKVA
jgi:hypothetical protein